ncbi:MAG: HAD hydrolase family protein [Terracidiphilus sp.]
MTARASGCRESHWDEDASGGSIDAGQRLATGNRLRPDLRLRQGATAPRVGAGPGHFAAGRAGDNENDAAALAAFHRAAMGGAAAQAKEAARKIIGDNSSDAVAETIGARAPGTSGNCLNGDPLIVYGLLSVQKVQLSINSRVGVRAVNVTRRILYGDAIVATTEEVSVPSYNLFNLGARYTPGGEQGRVTFRLYANNIADKRYWSDTGASLGDTFIWLGAPTTVRFSVHYTF